MAEESETLDLFLRYRSNLKDRLAADIRMIRQAAKGIPKLPLAFKPDPGSLKVLQGFEDRMERLAAKGGITVPVHFQVRNAAVRQEMADLRKGIGVPETVATRPARTPATEAEQSAASRRLEEMNERMEKGREASRRALEKVGLAPVGAVAGAGAEIPARLIPDTAALEALRKQEPIVIKVLADTSSAKASIQKLRDMGMVGGGGGGAAAPRGGTGGFILDPGFGARMGLGGAGGGGAGGGVVDLGGGGGGAGGAGRVLSVQRELKQAGEGYEEFRRKVTRELSETRQQVEHFQKGDARPFRITERDDLTRTSRREVDERLKNLRQEADMNARATRLARERIKSDVELGQRGQELNKVYDERVQKLRELRSASVDLQRGLVRQGRLDEAAKAGTAANFLTRQLGSEVVENRREQARVERDLARQRDVDARTFQRESERRMKDETAFFKREEQERLDAQKQRLRDELAEEKRAGQERRQAIRTESQAIRQEIASRPLSQAPIGGGPTKREREKITALRRRSQEELLLEAGRLERLAQDAQGVGDPATARSARQASMRALNEVGQAHVRLGDDVNKSGHAINMHSRSILRNAVTATSWLLPITAMYGALRLLTSGFRDLVGVDRQFATLQAVFDGTAESAQRLKRESLDLGVALGSREALDSSIRFARLQLTRNQIILASRDALVAQNVAEVSAAQGAEFLASVLQSYKLSLSDLPGLINRINAHSNNWNTTNKDLISGLQRVSGIARQSGFSLQNLEGVLAASIGASGRPGAEIGNALKFIITRIRRPETQAKLKEAFDINITDAITGELKTMDEILDELARLYPKLTRAQQAYFLDITAGARQASRLAIVLDSYTQSQLLSAKAALDANSAYEENVKILGSLESRLTSLTAAWGRLFTTTGDLGFTQELGRQVDNLTRGITVVDRLASKLPGEPREEFRVGSPDLDLLAKGSLIAKRMREAREKGFLNFAVQPLLELPGRDLTRKDFESIKDDPFFRKKVRERGLEGELEFELASKGIESAAITTASYAREVKVLAQELEGIRFAANFFDSLAEGAAKSGPEFLKLKQDAKELVDTLTRTGAAGGGEVRKALTDVLQGDNVGEIQEAFRRSRDILEGELPGLRSALEERKTKNAAEIEKEIEPLREQEAALERIIEKEAERRDRASKAGDDAELIKASEALDKYGEKVDDVRESLKELDETLRGIESAGAAPKVEEDSALASLEDRLKLLREFQSGVAGLVGLAGVGVPKTRGTVLAQAEAEIKLQRELLGVMKERALAQVEADRRQALLGVGRRAIDEVAAGGDQGVRVTRMRLQGEIMKRFAERAEAVRAAFETEEDTFGSRVADPRRQKALLGGGRADVGAAFEEGRLVAERFSAGVSVGLSESQKRISRVSALLGDIRGGVSPIDPVERFQRTGQVAKSVEIIQRDINSLREREVVIGAELLNQDLRRKEAIREAAGERSKSLALADRETQVMAAIAARDARRRQQEGKGGLGLEEFSMLPRDMKSIIQQFQPGMLDQRTRGLIDPTERQSGREARALSEELSLVTSSLGGLIQKFNEFDTSSIFQGVAEGLLSRVSGEGLASGESVLSEPPRFDIQLGDIQVSLDEKFSAAVRDIAGDLARRVDAELSAIRQQIGALDPRVVQQDVAAP